MNLARLRAASAAVLAAVIGTGCVAPRRAPAGGAGDGEVMPDVPGAWRFGVIETVAGTFIGDHVVSGGQVYLDADVTTALSSDASGVGKRPGVGVVNEAGLWEKGVVPYLFDEGGRCPCTTDDEATRFEYYPIRRVDRPRPGEPSLQRGKVRAAMRMWERGTPIRFVELTEPPPSGQYVRVCMWSSGYGKSRLGRQPADPDGQCLFTRPGSPVGGIAHELGHTLGLMHEQQRSDRDRYVRINWDDIQCPDPDDATTCKWGNFKSYIELEPARAAAIADLGGYDYRSIMHYGRGAYAKESRDTIIPRNGASIGNRREPSAGDLAAIREMYGRRRTSYRPGAVVVYTGRNRRGKSFSLTAPRHRSDELVGEGIYPVASVYVSPGLAVRVCATPGRRPDRCQEVPAGGGDIEPVLTPDVTIDRAATIWPDAAGEGRARSLRAGRHPADGSPIASAYVAPGLVLRVCADPRGRDCAEASWRQPLTRAIPAPRFIEVLPAVTLFGGAQYNDASRTYLPGTYLKSRGELDGLFGVHSLVSGGLVVRFCRDRGEGGEVCDTVDGDVGRLADGWEGNITRVEVLARCTGAGCPGTPPPLPADPPADPPVEEDPPSYCTMKPWMCDDGRRPPRR